MILNFPYYLKHEKSNCNRKWMHCNGQQVWLQQIVHWKHSLLVTLLGKSFDPDLKLESFVKDV